VKPANVFLAGDGTVKLGDFGLARENVFDDLDYTSSTYDASGDFVGITTSTSSISGSLNGEQSPLGVRATPSPSIRQSSSSVDSEHTSGLGTATYAAYEILIVSPLYDDDEYFVRLT